MLYQMVKLPMTAQNHPVSTFCIAFYIMVLGHCGDFKFDGQIDHNKSQPTDDKPSLKGAWLCHVAH